MITQTTHFALESLKDAYAEKNEQAIWIFWLRTLLDTIKSLITQYIENKKEGEGMKSTNQSILMQNKVFAYIALGTGFILLIPLALNYLVEGVQWDLFDFIVAGTVIFGMSSIFVFAARMLKTTKQRVIAGLVVLGLFLFLWVELAVGVFTNWGS